MAGVKLVLTSCCAPCSAGAIRQLADGQIPGVDDFIVLFYNPNIYPDTEYRRRLAEQIKYCESIGVKYAVGEYDHDAWREFIRGHEDAPERGSRCARCFEFRFAYAKKWARDHGYDAIASVFGVSRHKSGPQVDTAATVATGDIPYLPIKWDENLRQQIGRDMDFYRQNYCGCEFSIRK